MKKEEFTIEEVLYIAALMNGLIPDDDTRSEQLLRIIEIDRDHGKLFRRHHVVPDALLEKLTKLDPDSGVVVMLGLYEGWSRRDYQRTMPMFIVATLYAMNGIRPIEMECCDEDRTYEVVQDGRIFNFENVDLARSPKGLSVSIMLEMFRNS